MYYLIYKITNRINGMWYIGKHKTKNINDGYMGSGTILKLVQEQDGIENFDKEILFYLSTEDEMNKKEKELVEEDNPQTYNMVEGGAGGWTYVNSIMSIETRIERGKKGAASLKNRLENDSEFRKSYCENVKKYMKNQWEENPERFKNWVYDWTGKTHKKSTIDKMKKTHKNNNHQQGSKNSQYGKMWITNGLQSTRIIKYGFIPEGWRKGRIM